MTKYILVGGYPYKAKDGGKAMCNEAVAGFSEPVKILICLFARQSEQWDKLYEENKRFFIKNLSKIKLDFTLAAERDFENQIKDSNLLYFNGGDTAELMGRLGKVSEWLRVLEGKSVMGSSAGADILSTYNYDIEFFRCADGLGLVPVKTIVHYEVSNYTPPVGWGAAYNEIERYKEELPIWALHEGEYKVMQI